MASQQAETEQRHDYVSTACHHDLHGRCRQVCKFCDQPCRCACHALPPVRES